VLVGGATLLLAACATPSAKFAAGVPCESRNFVVSDQFEGARRGECEVFRNGRVRITITPEDPGEINNSPWYAFRLEPGVPGAARINIRYENGDHRYWPKWSVDGKRWQYVPAERVELRGRKGAYLDVELGTEPVFIAAQELRMPSDVEVWTRTLSARDDVERAVLGKSRQGRIIHRLDINPDAREVIFLAGGQHPPEVTGAIGFVAFYEALLADTALASAFRERFHIVAIPMLNPDGVVAGHWRHNMGGVDLNRDWGPFTQPETRSVSDLLDQLDADGKLVLVSVDFHSTRNNLIYRQEDVVRTVPEQFTQRWIAASLSRLPGYAFLDEPRPNSDLPTSRNYMHLRYGIPAVTYEVSDNEDRAVIRQSATVFAEELMRLFLEEPRRGY